MRKNDRRIRTARAAALLTLMLFAFSGAARALQFTLASQNCLRLGQGKKVNQTNKNKILRNLFAGYDVIVLQEVMAQANLGQVTPGTHQYIVTKLQGPGSYKEAYAFLVKSSINASPPYTTKVRGFMRPPAGVLVTTGGVSTWVVDYHAVHGNRKSLRTAEVKLIPQVHQEFQSLLVNGVKHNRVIFGGDWNLKANDPVFQSFTNVAVQPNKPTSMKRNGAPNHPYDHFLWVPKLLKVTNPDKIPIPNPPGSEKNWRKEVSDHVGIACKVF